MITNLTKVQTDKFPEYVREWVARGLTTKQRSLDDAIIDFGNFQKYILKKEIAPVVILNSPLECRVAVCLTKALFQESNCQVGSQVQSQVESQVWSQVRSQVRSQVESQVESQVWSQVRSQVESQVWSQVWSQVGSQVESQVRSQVESQVWSQVESQVPNFVYPYFDCQFQASWFSFYEFVKNELGVIYPNLKEYEYLKNCIGYGMVFPLDELCIVCQPPTEIHRNTNGLHNENGPALTYSGQNEIYALNGVTMDKQYVLAKAEDISSQDVLRETNIEVRRELLRKVEIERLLNDLPHKLLEKRGNYELFSISLSEEIKDARYLKMLNPSINVFHLEGVAPNISTIDAALDWRNQNFFTDAEILT